MFIGQDWGCETNLRALMKNPNADIQSGTGKILHDLLKEAEIPPEACFFTNALFGVRTGITNTGRSKGWKDNAFVSRCSDALKKQINTIRPKAIVCLGRDAPDLLAGLVTECDPWTKAETFKDIDRNDGALVNVSSIHGIIISAILLHPSFRRPNLKRRGFKGASGHQAELALLKVVWSRVGCSDS